jgi:hypothetical protein
MWLGLLIAFASAGLFGCLDTSSSMDGQSRLPVDSWYPGNPKAQALAVASEFGHVEEIRRLMKDEGVNPDTIFSTQGTPLLAWPVITENPTGLKAMLENGANPNARYPKPDIDRANDGSILRVGYKNNAMVWAAKAEDPIYLKLLLEHGGDPNTRNSNRETLLHQAFIWHNQWENVKLLVEHGADVNATSQGWPVILDYASGGGFMQTHWLLEHGAGPPKEGPLPPEFRHVVDSVYWFPSNSAGPIEWQKKCQQWLMQRGIQRPPMPEHFRRMRKDLGFPYEEQDIPLL